MTLAATAFKAYPLSLRLPASDMAMIDRAAALRGRSRTEFMRDAAVRAAEDVVLETIPVRMSHEGFQSFMAAVAAPAEPVAEMVTLLQRPAPWDRRL